jgi:putative methionine-R-sulfoxide reductase with GAF domain
MSVPKVIDAWSRGPQPWIDDLDDFVAQLPPSAANHLKCHVSTRAATAEGLKGFLYFPLWARGTIVSALSLAARTPHRSAALYWDVLNAIGLTQVLEFVRRGFEQRSEIFARRTDDLFQSYAADPPQLARAFVNEFAKEFSWDYVGIFRVARVEGYFRVLAQHDNTGQLTIDESYLQPLDRGVLGTVLREGHPIRIADVDKEGRHFDYIKLGAHKSCLCFPVFIGDAIEWIIDCESTQQAAFAQPDEDALRVLINNLQTTLRLWFEMQLSDALLEQIRQGAVITGASRRIERMNAKARQLFGVHDNPIEGLRLDAFGADDYSRDIFNRGHPVDNLHLKITGTDKVERGMLASSIVLGENRWIWVFTDTAEREWIAGLRYARATVEQVAAQARGPLMLAHSLIKRLSATIGAPEMQGEPGRQLFARILQTLSKADLTYERLAQALALRQQIEVGRLLGRFAERLAAEERAVLWLPYSTRTADVRGSPEVLCRALAGAFGHLYGLRRPDSPIACSVIPDQDHVAITFAAALTSAAGAARGTPADKLVLVEAAARFAAALPELAQRMGKDQPPIERARWDLLDEGGDLIETELPDGRHQLEIRLLKAAAPQRDSDD